MKKLNEKMLKLRRLAEYSTTIDERYFDLDGKRYFLEAFELATGKKTGLVWGRELTIAGTPKENGLMIRFNKAGNYVDCYR